MNLKSTVWDLAGVAAAALFTAVAQADTFYWMNKDGGEWSEPSNWRIGSSTGEVATCKPGLGDTATIRSDQLKTSYTIHLSEDVDVAAFIYFPDKATTGTVVTVDLDGHAFHATSEINARCDLVVPAVLHFKNGIIRCDTGYQSWNQAGGINVDRESGSTTETGRMIIENCTVSPTNTTRVSGRRGLMEIIDTKFLGGGLLANSGLGSLLYIAGEGTVVSAENSQVSCETSGKGVAWVTTNLIANGAFVYTKCLIASAGHSNEGSCMIVDNAKLHAWSRSTYFGHDIGYFSGTGAAGNARFIARNHAEVILNQSDIYLSFTNADADNPGKSSTNNWLIVESGATLTATNSGCQVGRQWGVDGHVVVNGGMLKLASMTLGAYSPVKIDNVTYEGVSSNNWLHVRGAASKIRLFSTGTAISFNYHTTVDFEIPEHGFDAIPVEGLYGKATAKHATVPGFESIASELHICADAFAIAHPNTKIDLMKFGKDSSVAFQELADHFTYIGKPHLRGALSISADGTTLSYTTPCKKGLVVIFF